MNNKWSELSKPVMFTESAEKLKAEAGLSVTAQPIKRWGADIPIYSQEYVSALREDAAKWFKAFAKAVSVGARYEERIAELEQAMRHIHGAALDITVPRTAIAKAAELAVEHTAMKEQSNG